MILTERLEELRRSELPVEENGAVVDVENSAHADQQDLQASCRGGPHTEAETWRDGQRRGRRKAKHKIEKVNNLDPDLCTAYICEDMETLRRPREISTLFCATRFCVMPCFLGKSLELHQRRGASWPHTDLLSAE